MSHIFDALRRLDAERSGTKTLATPTATELLERAERQALMQWEVDALSAGENDRGPTNADLGSVFRAGQSEDLTREAFGIGEAVGVAGRADAFPVFEEVETSHPENSRLVCLTQKDSPAAEAFRLLKVRLRHLRKDKPLRKVLITSTVPEEGKSFVAANLACALGASSTEKVLLVEGDLRRPTVSRSFAVGARPGIFECLRETNDLTSTIYNLSKIGIWLFPAGIMKGNPLEIIQSGRLPSMVEQLAEWFDWIVIDSPPMLPLADTTAWARLADGILLVTRRDVTEKRKLTKGLEAFEQGKLIGAVLNSSNSADDEGYYYYRREGAT